MIICRRVEAPASAITPPTDATIREDALQTQLKAEAVIFAPNGPGYPGVGNGSTSGPTQGSS